MWAKNQNSGVIVGEEKKSKVHEKQILPIIIKQKPEVKIEKKEDDEVKSVANFFPREKPAQTK